jgi:hypothetical protein
MAEPTPCSRISWRHAPALAVLGHGGERGLTALVIPYVDNAATRLWDGSLQMDDRTQTIGNPAL